MAPIRDQARTTSNWSRSAALLLLLMTTTACGTLEAVEPAATAKDATAVADARSFVKTGQTVQLARHADLDGDGDSDVVAVLASSIELNAPRTLLLLRRDATGTLVRVVENANAVPPQNAGGTMGDPLRDIEARTNGFTLLLEGGSRDLWSRVYRFEFDGAADTWRLTRFSSKTLDRLEGTSSENVLTPHDFGAVTASDFDPDDLVDVAQR